MVQNTLLWSSLITLFLSLTICLVFFSLLYFHSSHRVSIPPPHPCCSFHCRTEFPSSNLTLFLAWSFMDLGKGEGTNNNNDNKNNKQRTTVAMMKKELHQDEEEVEDYCCAEPGQMTGSTFENDNKISGKKKKGGGVVLGSSSGKKSSSSSGSGVVMGRCCQVEKCTADLSDAKQYHRRHRVCEHHAKAQFVLVAGLRQRFCQQCSRFHELSEFDETRRSCRRRLAGHNERRRKSSTETDAEGSGRRGTGTQQKDMACGGQVDDNRGRIQVAVQENATYKHFQIR